MTENKTINDGGPVFPIGGSDSGYPRCEGMSLREHYAGLAMQGIATALYGDRESFSDAAESAAKHGRTAHDFIAGQAIMCANALIDHVNDPELMGGAS